MRWLTLLVVPCLAACGGTESRPEPGPARPRAEPDVTYTLRPRPAGDRTVLAVTMAFHGSATGRTALSLPDDRYGVPDLYEQLSEVALEGASWTPGSGPDRELVHAPSAPIVVQYTMDWDPASRSGYAYRPSVGPSHFHFFDSQWRIGLPGHPAARRYELRFDGVPEGWQVLTNLGPGAGPFSAFARDEDLDVFVAGGTYRAARFDCQGTPVSVLVGGSVARPDELIDDVRSSIELFSSKFGGTGLEHYAVCITGRPKFRAGVAIDNAFVCFANPELTADRLLLLVAHETLHNWIPGQAAITEWVEGRESGGIDEYRLDWFIEGFVEYCARKALLEAGLLTLDQFVAAFNRDLAELAKNAQRHASLDDVARAIRDGGYTNRHERLSYTRGPLLALRWDGRQASAGRQRVVEIVEEFVAAAAPDGQLSEVAFFDLLERRGVDARGDYRRFIVDGTVLRPADHSFGPAYRIAEPLAEGPLRFVRR